MKYYIIGGIVLVGGAYYLGYSNAPIQTVTEIKEKIVTVEGKERVKNVYIKEIKQPDGTVIKETTEKEEEITHTVSTGTKQVEETKTAYIPQYHVNVFATTPLTDPKFGVSISKKFIGPITIGVTGIHQPGNLPAVGVNLGIMF